MLNTVRSVVLLALLGGCAAQDVVYQKPSAQFVSYPSDLFDAFETACHGPARSFKRHDENTYECREFMPPGATAAAILEFDGHPEDLPQLVIQFRARENDPGYLVDAELFLNVPQKQGADKKVTPTDPRIRRRINRLFKAAGGTPI